MNWLKAGVRKYVFILALKGMLSTFLFMAVINVTYGFYVQKIDLAMRLEKFKMLDRVFQNQFGDNQEYIDLVKLDALLKEFVETNIINAYRVTLNDEIYSYFLIDRKNTYFEKEWPQTRAPASFGERPLYREPMDLEKVTFKIFNFSTQEQNIGVLIIFFKPRPWEAYINELRYQALPMILIFFGIFLTLFLFIILSRNEFVLLFHNLSKVNAPNFSHVTAHSPEGLGLINYTQSLNQKANALTTVNQEIRGQLESGKLWVLELYKKGIMSFEGSLVRVDLNGYTSKRNAMGEDTEKKRFFEKEFRFWGEAICSKYNVLVYEFIGDEFVVLVPEQSDWDHHLVALHLVRSFFEDLSTLNRKFEALKLPELSIKATFISGSLELKKEQEHISLDSEPLILTQRLLSNVQEKTHSCLILFQEEARDLKQHALFSDPEPVKFKADDNFSPRFYQKTTSIYGWQQYKNQNQLLEHLVYLRSEQDLHLNLKQLREDLFHSQANNQNPSREDFFWKVLLQTKNENPSEELLCEVDHLINYFSGYRGDSSINFGKSLAQSVVLARNYYPYSKNQQRILKFLMDLAQSPYARVVANARESVFQLAPHQVDLLTFIHSKNHRAAADSLIDLAKKEGIGPFIVSQLDSWIFGDRPEFKLSGLYAIFSISLYFKQARPEYFTSNESFVKLKSLMLRAQSIQDPQCQKWINRYQSEIL